MTPADGTLEDRILGGLDEEQREVASTLTGPICVLAGAGTGKTRAITHRIAYGVHSGVYSPQRLLAVTFTARAAAEMRSRLRDLGVPNVQARTFHAAALRQLQFFWPQAIGGTLPSLLDHKANMIAEASRRLRLSTDRASIRDLAAEIEWAKVSMLTPANYLENAQGRGTPGGLDLTAVSRVFQAYEDIKTDRNVIDFEDVLLITVGILQEDPKVAATVREQYRHFVVDEYQDVSPLQQRLLDLWLGERDELCVVGDASQTIYSFTGASPQHLLGFKARYPKATVVKLIRDYRSTPQVVKLANDLLGSRRSGGPAADAAWAPPLKLVAQRPVGPDPRFVECPDDEAEAAVVAGKIQELLNAGVKASEIAILFRTNGQSEAYEQALASAGIGYQLRGGERFFARKEVRDAILQLRAATRAVAEGPQETLGQVVRDIIASLGYTENAPHSGGALRERWESLAALVALADELSATRGESFTLAEFVNELQERSVAQHAPTVQGVTLASLHAAKGLEWDAVFLVGLSEGLMPISFADSPEDVDEERRLLYVGITRAREHLNLSWSTARTPGGRANRKPSRFLDGLRPDSVATANARSSAGKPRRKAAAPASCRVCGSMLATGAERKVGRCNQCPPSYEEQTFEALRQWRREEAQSADVPAYVVFTDATLTAIAEARPGSLEQLAGLAGVGPSKLERYGEAVLQVIEQSSGH
ncbi:ATP-dependent DNA helicase UvrD2 [Arthrobacter sp. TES]|uniref:ATP-dependent DNA helicase UvrD2 n=1 Tax=Paenarthrobacter TaxID=1742992 RepID=UPI0004CE03B2|nr:MULTISPECIES: ATP-dependent DNA helicase UvrD2 [Paenarthrobacter]AMB42565.1 ATP-dependent DNA helicase [Arthrobacter sp. ATCC 21022]ERI38233.2 ATP-dependent DNA helicase [Arthrobacter sp. AK-YN10]QOI65463.1 ATP-dependent DNA helicase UvrD2 [Arthrobacter sp. TES]KUR66013.1 ATP-dependent DNA helicase [Arthrobacter sp. ATCC 21022]NWL28105.1 ATP-dependent DNA helicase UvrD2 [Paenarthrobacter ureafaciens]